MTASYRSRCIRVIGWILAVATGVVLGVAALGFYRFNFTDGGDILPGINAPAEVACTMEAKLCPDGSAVGRSGPRCEFAPCPGE
mgnify:FL=1